MASPVPQTSLPYELVTLALILWNAVEVGFFALGATVDQYALWTLLRVWPVMLGTIYLLMLYLMKKPQLSRTQSQVSIPSHVTANDLG